MVRNTRMRMAPNAATSVGRSFPGEGSERFPSELNNRTRRNTRVRAEPHVRDRIPHAQDIDPAMPALNPGGPWRAPSDAHPSSAISPTPAGGAPHPARCRCGQH